MKSWQHPLLTILATTSLLVACSKEAPEPAPIPEVAPTTLPAPVEQAPVISEKGGYVQTEEEKYHPPAAATTEPAPATETAPAETAK